MLKKVGQCSESQENIGLNSQTERFSARHLHDENQKYFQKSGVELYGQLQRLKQINDRFDVYYDGEGSPIREVPRTFRAVGE